MQNKRPDGLRTWIEIDKKALAGNFNAFRKLVGEKVKILSVIKSNAYGHSLLDFANFMEDKADWFGVDSAVEAISLRKSGIKKPILVLGFSLPEMYGFLAENDVSFAISSFDQLEQLKKAKSENVKKIHIKVDTGMSRQGFLEKDLPEVLNVLKNLEGVLVEGLFTHFAMAKNPAFPAFTNNQILIFKKWVETFKKAGLNPIAHASATGGTILYKDAHFDMVRVGIGMYGIWPSKETKEFAKDNLDLKPILSWKTVVGEVKEIPAGSKVGYDCTETALEDSKIAVCPIGYWHGYGRVFSSIGRVLVRGEKARILGRVSMDMIVIDVTHIKDVKSLDEVVVVGKQGENEVGAEYLADIVDMSAYELVTRINPLIKRFYI
jgi:alanine racemase